MRRRLALWALCLLTVVSGALIATPSHARAQETELVLGDGGPLYSQSSRPRITGRTTAAAGSLVTLRIDEAAATATVEADGGFSLEWPQELAPGLYRVQAEVGGATAAADLRVESRATLPRRPLLVPPVDVALPEGPEAGDFLPTTDRWRLPLPPEATGSRGRWDPYHQNKWKGDYPLHGEDRFLVLTGISDTLVDGFQVPTPSGVSMSRPGSFGFFGQEEQVLVQQLLLLSADYYRGSTVFKPFDWRLRGTLALNGNYLNTRENAVVRPDVREGVDRFDGKVAVQELFFEKKLTDLSANYDFLSIRVGVQPFSSDFRGFVFTDTNLGVRLFGNLRSNKWQYNLAYFERLEKDTNSGLNTLELRDQRVAVANFYRQDLRLGYTAQWSLHYLKDEATFLLDENGFLARPDPVGSATPHEIEALYLGFAGFGHFGRINVDHALYWATGEDSLNPIAGADVFAGREDVDIGGGMAALELSMDRNWYRPKVAVLLSTGDDDPVDRDAEGFAPIFENPAFAGGAFSFWNRLGIRLAGTGTALVHRGSLIPDLRASKEEGQPNFVNPGLLLVGLGLDVEATPELRLVVTLNHLRFETTEVLELLTFQGEVGREIGLDLSLGARWRPFLNNNVVVFGGVAGFLPGQGFEDIYEDDSALVGAFANVRLVF